jgi:hypothetical protein
MADLAAEHGKCDALLDVAVAIDGGRNGPRNALPCIQREYVDAQVVGTTTSRDEFGSHAPIP